MNDNIIIKLLAVNPAHAYHVIGEIPGEVGNVKFMIDTGAAVSLIREDIWKRVAGSEPTLKAWTGCKLVGAEGSPIEINGTAALTFLIAGQKVYGEFLVTNRLNSEAILGLDFLQQNQCIINAEQHTVHLRGKAVAISGGGTRKSRQIVDPCVVQLVIPNQLTIPPLSEIETMASTLGQHSCAGHHTYLVEATNSARANDRPPIIVANAIVAPNVADGSVPLVPIRLTNPSPDPITLRRGTKVAQVVPILESELITGISYDSGCISATTVTNKELPLEAKEALWKMVEDCREVLDSHQQQELYTFLLGFADVFAFTDAELGRTDKLQHTIATEAKHLIRSPVRRIPAVHKKEVHQLIQDMLARNVIQPSTSPWASPIVIVRKKDGSARFCVDYRKLNAITRKDAYPLPRIDDTLDMLSGSRWFSTLDLLSGYWQVEVAEGDRDKTAFATQSGLFEFKVMPFGLCNAPATFQRLMDLVLAGVQWSHCLVYMDDIIVVGRSFKDHLQNLSVVLQRLKEANLRLKPAKCSFCKRQLIFCRSPVC